MVALPGSVLESYPRFSLYNSPYPEHDAGTAIDLYPDRDDQKAPSPVAGAVTDIRTVRCPPQPYAVEHDHLIVVDTGTQLARILHVDPAVEVGDTVEVGETLGHLVRSGFFAPWVANHLHVAFRPPAANAIRARGSLAIDLPLDHRIEAVPWNGTGTVIETGDTWALLDEPSHPAPGQRFAGIASDDGRVLDGGLPHYDYGGVRIPRGGTGGIDPRDGETDEISLLGTDVGDLTGGIETGDRRTVDWRAVTVTANEEAILGLSLFLSRDWLGAKLVHRDHNWSVGDDIRVEITPRDGRGDSQ